MFSRINTNRLKFSDDNVALFGFITSDPTEKTRSIAAELRMPVLYFKKTAIQALRWNTGKDSNWNCVFHVGFVAIQSSIVLLIKEDICPLSVGVVLNAKFATCIVSSLGLFLYQSMAVVINLPYVNLYRT